MELINLFKTYGEIDATNKKIMINLSEFDKETQNFYRSKIKVFHLFEDNRLIFEKCNALDFFFTLYDGKDKNLLELFYDKGMIQCDVMKMSEYAFIPSKSRASDVGFDITIIKKIKEINENTTMYDTGIKICPEYGYYSQIFPRSSLIKSGYILTNSVGIIDGNYRGTLKICLTKISPDAPEIFLPYKCCQLIFFEHFQTVMNEVDTMYETERSEGGFGSTNDFDFEAFKAYMREEE